MVSLRTRLTLAGGGAVLVALALTSLVIDVSVSSKLREQIDASLIQEAQKVAIRSSDPGIRRELFSADWMSVDADDGGTVYTQLVPSLATVTRQSRDPLTPQERLVAAGADGFFFRDGTFRGKPARFLTMRLAPTGDGLVRATRLLTEANATIGGVRRLLVGLTFGGALAAALLGWLAAAAVLRPVRRLAAAANEVTSTRDLNRRIPVSGRDEVGSLAENFNAMLAVLDDSRRTQQQLIADASHELRTPLTAHRANVELLARPDLPPERRSQVLAATIRGIDELSSLVADLIQAARDERSIDARTPVALDGLVAAAVERTKRRATGLRFTTRLQPCTIPGAAARLDRAVDNVLDNAVKWSPADGTVEVTLADGVLVVRDHGPGIDDADLPHVFDRFHRTAAARGRPGSGLGLAISSRRSRTTAAASPRPTPAAAGP